MKFAKCGDDLLLSGVGRDNNIVLRFFAQSNQFNVGIHRGDDLVAAFIGTYLVLIEEDISIRYIEKLKRILVTVNSHSVIFDQYLDKIEFSYRITYLGNGDIYYSHWEIYYFEEDKINRSVAIIGDEPMELER